ncbi:uncharacterized protein [Notamacropus eugenii]|uniref:uncharacterized protein n=1 Tax=Notamacropus eugenii TaxID=9315 RepID=UPI003B680222
MQMGNGSRSSHLHSTSQGPAVAQPPLKSLPNTDLALAMCASTSLSMCTSLENTLPRSSLCALTPTPFSSRQKPDLSLQNEISNQDHVRLGPKRELGAEIHHS